MAMVIPNEGAEELLGRMLNEEVSDNLVLHLYSDNETPSVTSVVADFTEVNFTGYASITLTGGSWTVSSSTGTATADYAQQSFVMTSGGDIYGYYITNAAGTILIGAEFLNGGSAITVPGGGGTIRVTPSITLADTV